MQFLSKFSVKTYARRASIFVVVVFNWLLPSPGWSSDQGGFFGVTSHFIHNNRFYPELGPYWSVEKLTPIERDLGVRTVHEGLYALTAPTRALVSNGSTNPAVLQNVEVNRRQVSDWLKEYDRTGIKVIMAVLGNAPGKGADASNTEFAAWIADLVALHPCIFAVQLHNEPNLRSFWRGTPEDYVRTYRPFAETIRSRRPDVMIYGGAISSLWWGPGVAWLKQAVDAGLLEFVDGIAMHPYNVSKPPEIDPHWNGATTKDPDRRGPALRAFWAQISEWNRNHRPLKLIFTEYGYSTAQKPVIAELTQADYVSRSSLIYMDARLSGVPIASVYWYDLKDDGQVEDNMQHHYGLVSYDLTRRKPAFDAYQAVAKFFGNVDDFSSIQGVASVAAPDVVLKTWRRKSDGAIVVAFWSTGAAAANSNSMEINLGSTGLTRAMLYVADKGTPTQVAIRRSENAAVAEVKVSTRPQWLLLGGS